MPAKANLEFIESRENDFDKLLRPAESNADQGYTPDNGDED